MSGYGRIRITYGPTWIRIEAGTKRYPGCYDDTSGHPPHYSPHMDHAWLEGTGIFETKEYEAPDLNNEKYVRWAEREVDNAIRRG